MTTNQPAPAQSTDADLLRVYNAELLRVYGAEVETGDWHRAMLAATVAGLRAVIAVDRATRATPPADHIPGATKMLIPPADGADGPSIEQLGPLISWLTEQCCQVTDAGRSADAGMLLWAAQVVGERVDEDALDSTPPAEGEAGKLAEWMGDHAAHLRTMEEIWALPQTELPARLYRAADLLKQQAAELAECREALRRVRLQERIPGGFW